MERIALCLCQPNGPQSTRACGRRRPRTPCRIVRITALVLGILLFWEATAQADLTIMPLGASIAAGNGVPGGFRTRLYSKLHDAGYSFTFVGTSTDNSSPLLLQAGQTHHEGHPGYRIDQIANNLDGYDPSTGSDNNGGFWFHKPAPPNVIFLEAGRNDIRQNFQVPTMGQRMDALVGQIVSDSPASILFLSSSVPTGFDANQLQLLQAYNMQIRDDIVPKYQSMGANVIFVDQYANFVDADGHIIHGGPDGLHPDATGYDLMGDTWAAALQQAIPLAQPIRVTGYSADVISDKDPSARFAQPFHAGTFAWFEAGAVDDNGAQHEDGLPAGLTFLSATGSGASYQIQPPSANNVLQLSAGQTATLTLPTPAAYSTLYVLASSGDGTSSSVGSGTITFADGSVQGFSYNCFDWCNGPESWHPEAVLTGTHGRADVGTDGKAFVYNQDCDFQLYETVIAIDPSHAGVAIASIDFTAAPDAFASSIFAVSGR